LPQVGIQNPGRSKTWQHQLARGNPAHFESMAMKTPNYLLRPIAVTDIVVRIEGIVNHDNGTQNDIYIEQFTGSKDFVAWLESVIDAMENKTPIALDHGYYFSYEMTPRKLYISGTMVRKAHRVHLKSSAEVMKGNYDESSD
jgi:hypothetical protein